MLFIGVTLRIKLVHEQVMAYINTHWILSGIVIITMRKKQAGTSIGSFLKNVQMKLHQ